MDWNEALSLPEGSAERRESVRFPINREMQFRSGKGAAAIRGVGTTVNVSTSGILFTTSSPAPAAGKLIVIAIHWPVKLNEYCELRLVARGRVTRVADGEVAVAVKRYEFRTTAVR